MSRMEEIAWRVKATIWLIVTLTTIGAIVVWASAPVLKWLDRHPAVNF